MSNNNTINFGAQISFPILDSILDDIENRILSPLSCLIEFNNYWLIELDLPMVNKKDIKISSNQNTLHIEARLREKYSEEKLGKVTKFEYFKKSVYLPAMINIKKISAEFDRGRLSIKIPKKLQSRSIQVK